MPVVDVTPVEVDEAASSVATNTAKEIEEPKGPIGKTLKFINENASKLEEQIEVNIGSKYLSNDYSKIVIFTA